MTPFGRFFLPGPTEVHPEVLAAMSRPVIGHRGPEMTELLRGIDPHLRAVFGSSRPVYVSTSSATGLMEAAVRGGVRRRALCLVNGAFSGRFRDLVLDCGREAETYEVPWGEAHDADEVERQLRADGFDAVTVVHSETSTGVLNPLPEIAQAVRRAADAAGEEVLLLVDGVTSVGGVEVDPEGLGLDFLLTGSQKALALPPGLAFGTASERMLRRAEALPGRGQYLDVVELDRYWSRHQTPQTPAIHLIFALAEQMRRISADGGIAARAERHRRMAERCWKWAEETGQRWGLRLFAPSGRRSPTVTAIALPSERTGSGIQAALAERGWTIGTGYGKLREATLRIGHMGDHTVEELDALLDQLEAVLG
ncbi:MAG: alanine--glyoxylate aminotransferase family protein [Gemmatimonadota bacterium]|jgi:aspartate aminotransferase-like enzyme|nr:alanine--glyoxylate aminotransferase family protein [Gemmatimonadota bacterium]